MNLFRRIIAGPRLLLVAGIVLLLLWAGWWGISLARPVPRLWPGPAGDAGYRITYLLIWPFVGLDFQHNYAAVNSWLAGHDPYVAIVDDPMNEHYIYPPLTLFAFAWAGLFPPDSVTTHVSFAGPVGDTPFPYCRPAIFLWMAASVFIVGFAGWQSWRGRERQRLPALPLPFILGAALLSYPVMFELERGNCDVLPLLAVALLLPALARRQRLAGDLLAAACVAFATGIKAYPGILLLGLIALRRFRAAALAAGLLLLQIVVLWQPFRQWFAITRAESNFSTSLYMDYSHSLAAHWKLLWTTLGVPALGQVHGELIVDLLVLAAVLIVSWRVFRSKPEVAVAWPYLLWLTTMGTLVNVTAYDYSLIFLPLAALAAWSHRDPWRTQLCVLPMLLWWQPFYLGVTGLPWLLLKAASLFMVGGLVIRRLPPTAAAQPVSVTGSPVRAP
jgi:hypothetical protein